MRQFDFSCFRIGSWLQNGMVTAPKPAQGFGEQKRSKEEKLPKHKAGTPELDEDQRPSVIRSATLVAALVIGANFGGLAHAVTAPNQVAVALPGKTDRTKDALRASLRNIEVAHQDWEGYEVPIPSRQSLTAAKQVIEKLPTMVADASAGVDSDGNVFLKLQRGEKVAYLTIEPSVMHLLLMAPNGNNVYFDDVRFQPRHVPPKISAALLRELAG